MVLQSRQYTSICTQDVDVNGGGGAPTGVHRLDDVGGGVSSGGVGDGQLGVSWLGVNGDAVISPKDQIGLGPLHPGIRLPLDVGRELDLGSSPCGQTSQQLHIQLDLWRLCGRCLEVQCQREQMVGESYTGSSRSHN